MQKLSAIFSTGSGWSLVVLFVISGLTAIQSHLTGNAQADVATIISILGILSHPTDMVGGRTKAK
jgi:hypothetical protein